MKELIRMLEMIWISVAFAEAGEQETAKIFMDPEHCIEERVVTCQVS